MNGAHFIAASSNRKLSPVIAVPYLKAKADSMFRVSPRPVAPFCAITYVSIKKTCDDVCAFKKSGCYVQQGFTKRLATKLDVEARKQTPGSVIAAEASLIDAFKPKGITDKRDLRLHVGGDIGSIYGAARLGRAAKDWRARGGGTVWTYTHAWRDISRDWWGDDITVLASVERTEDFERVRRKGYAPAIVVPRFKSKRAWKVGDWRVIPCPAETGSITCVQCRLCLDRDLYGMKAAIAFAAHGKEANKVRRRLPVVK